jgi:hypothetical protein
MEQLDRCMSSNSSKALLRGWGGSGGSSRYHSTLFALFLGQRRDIAWIREHPRILGGQTKGSVVDLNDPPFEARKTRHVWNS